MFKYVSVLILVLSLSSCQSQKTEREIEDEFVKKYAPKDCICIAWILSQCVFSSLVI